MRPFLVPCAVLLLVLPLAVAQAPAQADVPSWLVPWLEARGVAPEDWDEVKVERRVFEDGAWRTEAGPLDDLAQLSRAAPPRADVVMGSLALHLMLQTDCAGYSVEPLAGDVVKVGGSWEVGLHVASVQGAFPPGVDASDPENSLLSASIHEDVSVAGVGSVVLQEDRIVLFGQCLLLVGTMSGVGVFAFGQSWPA